MTDLLKSLVRSNWSVSVRGLRHTAGRLATATGLATPGQVEDLSRALFQAGDQLNEAMLEGLRDCLRPEGLEQNARSLADVSSHSTRLLRQDRDGRAARQEFQNRLEVFRLVRYEQPEFAAGEDTAAFEHAVDRAYARDAHRALWIVEGLAHKFVIGRLRRGERPEALFAPPPAGLPAGCRPMLHAGLGLAAAEHLLERFTPGKDDADALVREFIDRCRANAEAEHLDAALEALGLVARCFYPESVDPLGEAVPRVAPELEPSLAGALHEILWHGIGRGVYFIPLSFVPGYGSIGRALDTVRRVAPDDAALDAALAGLGYAYTMVNMAHPAVLEALVRERGGELEGAFARGLLAAFVARHEVTPEYPLLQAFLDHRPAGSEKRWEALVREPCRRVLAATSSEERNAILGSVYRSL